MIQVLPFLGKESEWRMWSRKFIATAIARGYKEVLEPINPSAEPSAKDNNKAYNDLILSISDDVTFGIVDKVKSTPFPMGDARLVWLEMKKNMNPR